MEKIYDYKIEELERIVSLKSEENVVDLGVGEAIVMFARKVKKYNSSLKLTGNFLLISDRQRPLANELAKFLADETGANVVSVISNVEDLEGVKLAVDYLIVVGLPFEEICGKIIEHLRFRHEFLRTVIYASLSDAVRLYAEDYKIQWKYDKRHSLEEFVLMLKVIEDEYDSDFLNECYYRYLDKKFRQSISLKKKEKIFPNGVVALICILFFCYLYFHVAIYLVRE